MELKLGHHTKDGIEVVDVEGDAVGEVVELEPGEDDGDEEQGDRPPAGDADQVGDQLLGAVHEHRDAEHEFDDRDHGQLLAEPSGIRDRLRW